MAFFAFYIIYLTFVLRFSPLKIDLPKISFMRITFISVLTLLIITAACKKNQTFTIVGKVPDSVFNGSKVYLVALDAPVTRNVDSTIIENGSFRFEIKADSFTARILRIPAKYPDIIEDLVVIPEPGQISAVLDSVSYGQGTRLNNMLQQWKERKHIHDSIQWDLYIQKNIKGLDQNIIDSLMKVSEKMSEIIMSDNICMINENLNNGIGLLLFKIYFNALPAGEKNYVMQMTGKKYFERDAELRKRLQ